jgi:hypothetical protein
MAEEAPKEKLVKVKVRVPDRSQAGHKGYYAVQRLWPNGDSEAVIPESKLAELEAETNFLAVISKEPVSGDASEQAPEPSAKPPPEPPAEDKHSPARPLRR